MEQEKPTDGRPSPAQARKTVWLREQLLRLPVNACRLVLGLTFVFSGFVKAVDPLGTQYKIQDYLAALGLQGLVPDLLTLGASVLLSALEFACFSPSAAGWPRGSRWP